MTKTSEGLAIPGFFVALGEESQTFKQELVVNTARSGVYYKREDLVSTLGSNPVLKDKDMDIVDISVPKHAIVNPNCTKYGIKHGMKIPILRIQHFKDAVIEMQA